jgi:large subunit ribosomal protein L35
MKLKTKKSAFKRIKVKKKVFVRKKAYKSHLLRKKNSTRLRRLSEPMNIKKADLSQFSLLLPYHSLMT